MLVLDTTQGSSYDVTPETARLIRTGIAKNIDLTDVPDPEALLKVMGIAGMPAMGSPLSAAYPFLVLSRVRVLPLRAGGPQWATVELEYLVEQDEFTPTSYIVRRSSRITQSKTAKIPGLGMEISVEFTPEEGIEKVDSDIVFGTFYRPARLISVTALRYGHPTGSAEDHVGKVNNNTWPQGQVTLRSSFGTQAASVGAAPPSQSATSPLPRGYWMLAAYESQHDASHGMTMVTCEATSRVFEDWSEYFFLPNKKTGKYPFGELSAGRRQAIWDQLTVPAYTHGIIHRGNGVLRVGPAPMVDFQSLFGF